MITKGAVVFFAERSDSDKLLDQSGPVFQARRLTDLKRNPKVNNKNGVTNVPQNR
jgi:hypothetical protein